VKRLISTLCLTTLLLSGGVASAAQVSFDVRIGAPPPPRVVRVVPRRPGPQYVWVDGYWFPERGRYVWHDGYWTRPPFPGAYWVAPYHVDGRYYVGRWEDGRRSFRHDHRWDRSKLRDERRYRDDRR